LRDRLSVSKRAATTFDLETLILKKLKKVKVVELYGLKMSKKLADLENLDDRGGINRAWEIIRENIKISGMEFIDQCELDGYKPWYGEKILKI
jgi:hypothetical protein